MSAMKNLYTLTMNDYRDSQGWRVQTIEADTVKVEAGHFIFQQVPDGVLCTVATSQVLQLDTRQNPEWTEPTPEPRDVTRAVREICPGDPSHYADAHDPGGFWYGTSLDHKATVQTGDDQ